MARKIVNFLVNNVRRSGFHGIMGLAGIAKAPGNPIIAGLLG
jgi:hypothetical protein